MAQERITETMMFETIKAIVEGRDLPYENIFVEDVTEWVDKKLAQKAVKAEKAKAARAEKKAQGDELQAKVLELVTDEFQSAQEITDAIGDAEVTKAKVQYRLTQLVNAGTVVKDVVKNEETKAKVTVYKLA